MIYTTRVFILLVVIVWYPCFEDCWELLMSQNINSTNGEKIYSLYSSSLIIHFYPLTAGYVCKIHSSYNHQNFLNHTCNNDINDEHEYCTDDIDMR